MWPPGQRGGGGGGLQAEYLLLLLHLVIQINIKLNMTMFWKVEFWSFDPDLLTPSPGSVEVCRQNVCDHSAAFVIPFNYLICNMTMLWKSGGGEGYEGKIFATMLLLFVIP